MKCDDVKPRLREKIIVREEKWGAILCDKVIGAIYELNEDSYRLLKLCDGTKTLRDIVEILSKEYETSPDEMKTIVEEHLETLFKQHIIVERPVNLKKLAEARVRKQDRKRVSYGGEMPEVISGFERFRERTLSAPLSVSFEVTYSCNLCCKHCYANAGAPLDGELTTEQIFRFIDELAEMKVFSISLTGGEPLTRKDIFHIIQRCVDNDIGVLLSTNGTLITREKAERLKKMETVAVQVSIDSVHPQIHDALRGIKGAHRRAMKGLKNVLNAGIQNVRVATVATKLNFNEIPLLVDELDRMGVLFQRILRFLPLGRGEKQKELELSNQEIKLLLETLEKKQTEAGIITVDFSDAFNPPIIDRPTHACTGGVLWCAVNPKGYVVPCTYLNSMEVALDLKAESIANKSLKEIWENYYLFKALREPSLFLKEKCQNCVYRPTCGGGCRAAAYAHSGDIFGYDPHCTLIPK